RQQVAANPYGLLLMEHSFLGIQRGIRVVQGFALMIAGLRNRDKRKAVFDLLRIAVSDAAHRFGKEPDHIDVGRAGAAVGGPRQSLLKEILGLDRTAKGVPRGNLAQSRPTSWRQRADRIRDLIPAPTGRDRARGHACGSLRLPMRTKTSTTDMQAMSAASSDFRIGSQDAIPALAGRVGNRSRS